jgi:hypothetical protein
MGVVATIRPVLEFASFTATVTLALGVIVAWRQLRHIRKDSNIRVLREAKQQAIAASEEYMRAFCEHECFTEKFVNIHPVYDGDIGDFMFSGMDRKGQDSGLKKMGIDAYRPAFNHLEAIASRFTTGIADENTGFSIIGRSYCATVEDNYDFIAGCRDVDDTAPYWKNIVELYSWWRPRLEALELEKSVESFNERIARLKRTTPRNPVGM